MAAIIFSVFCISFIFFQGAFAQCIRTSLFADELAFAGLPLASTGLAATIRNYVSSPLVANCGQAGYNFKVAPTSGTGFAVTSTSPITPSGIIVTSENAIEGALSVFGELPFLSAVIFDGDVPTAGLAAINYGCGNQPVGISDIAHGAFSALSPTFSGKLGAGSALSVCSPSAVVGTGFSYNGLSGYNPKF